MSNFGPSRALTIMGSGPAGCTAAIYAARAGYSPLLLTGYEPGGQLMSTTEIANWPGIPSIDAPLLMDNMLSHVREYDVEIIESAVNQVHLSSSETIIQTPKGEFKSQAMIVAIGAKPRYLSIPGEKELLGRGVSTCATCDGNFFRNQDVAVVGGGNHAVEEALYLANIASKVTLIHRRNQLRAEHALAGKLLKLAGRSDSNVEIIWNSNVEEVIGKGGILNSIRIINNNGERRIIDISGFFVAVGHIPNTEIFQGQIEIDSGGYIQLQRKKPHLTQTSLPNIFAAGDVADDVYRQAVTSAGSGCMAAIDATRYLGTLKK